MKDGRQSKTLLLVDLTSFPKKCGELVDLYDLVKDEVELAQVKTESPTEFFKLALKLAEQYQLVVPVTRNLFIRDRLRMEGVNLIICL